MASNNNRAASTKILAYLQTGRDLTAAQIRARYGISNVSARISELRDAGYPIYCNTKRRGNTTIRAYRIGSATRRVIAAGQLVQTDPILKSSLGPTIERNLARV